MNEKMYQVVVVRYTYDYPDGVPEYDDDDNVYSLDEAREYISRLEQGIYRLLPGEYARPTYIIVPDSIVSRRDTWDYDLSDTDGCGECNACYREMAEQEIARLTQYAVK